MPTTRALNFDARRRRHQTANYDNYGTMRILQSSRLLVAGKNWRQIVVRRVADFAKQQIAGRGLAAESSAPKN